MLSYQKELEHIFCDASSKQLNSLILRAFDDENGDTVHLRHVNNKDIADSIEVKCVPRFGKNKGHMWYSSKIKYHMIFDNNMVKICIDEFQIPFNSTLRTYKWTGDKYISKKPDEGTGTKLERNFADGERTLSPVY